MTSVQRVLCYGASLVEGLTRNPKTSDQMFAPFSDFLGSYSNNQLQGICHGISGQTSKEVLERFSNEARKGLVKADDTVTFLCGTNDIGLGVPESETLKNIKSLAECARQYKAKPILMTLPPYGREILLATPWHPDGDSNQGVELLSKIVSMNKGIREIAASFPCPVFDTFAVLSDPIQPGDKSGLRVLKPEFNCDGLHLTKLGYDFVSKQLAEFIVAQSQK